jgi:hypothetical protein
MGLSDHLLFLLWLQKEIQTTMTSKINILTLNTRSVTNADFLLIVFFQQNTLLLRKYSG